jgi:hypothetical protein
VNQEKGKAVPPTPPNGLDHGDRRAMLSAVRAAVNRTHSMVDSQ